MNHDTVIVKLTDEMMSQPADLKAVHRVYLSNVWLERGLRTLTLMFLCEKYVAPITNPPDFG